MPTDETFSAEELFDFLMSQLQALNAEQLIDEIKKSINKGVVITDSGEKSKSFREMTNEERLSIALEYLLTSFDIPLMIAKCKRIFDCEEIILNDRRMYPMRFLDIPPPVGNYSE
jgi:hypothetical protein